MGRTTQTANRVHSHFANFRDKGYRDLRLDNGADGSVVLVGKQFAEDKTFTEHSKVIYKPRNGLTKTATKNYIRIAGEFRHFARSNPGVCSEIDGDFSDEQSVIAVIMFFITLIICGVVFAVRGY